MKLFKLLCSIGLVTILLLSFLPSKQTNAINESINESWKLIHLVIKEQDYSQGEVREILWDYYRDDQGHWIKKIKDISGVSNPEEHIGYFLSFDGEKVSEFFPNSNQTFITKVEDDVQYEADFFIQPQRVFEVKTHKNKPTKVKFKNKESNKLEVQNSKANSKQSFIYDGDFIQYFCLHVSDELIRRFEVLEINKINKKTYQQELESILSNDSKVIIE